MSRNTQSEVSQIPLTPDEEEKADYKGQQDDGTQVRDASFVEKSGEVIPAQEAALPNADEMAYDKEASRRLVRRMDLRLITWASWSYLISYIDRTNIGNAKVAGASHTGLMDSLNLTSQEYNTALCLFLLSYLLFGPPGNLAMKRVGPPIWLGSIMVVWGICTMCLGAVQTYGQLCAVRWLLGMAEASLFGSLIYTFTFYYRPDERSLRIALMLASATLAGAFGGALATGISTLDGKYGIAAWRWIFIIEGIPPIVTGPLLYFFYPSFPETAKWLSEEEKRLVIARLAGTNSSKSTDKIGWTQIKEAFAEKKMYLHYLMQFCLSLPFSSLSFFVPSIVQGLGYKGIDSNLFTVPPWAFAWFCCVFAAFLGDRYNRRGIVNSCSALIGVIAFAVMGALPGDQFHIRYGFLFIATAATFSCFPLLSGWVSANARTTGIAAIAIPVNLSIGAIGQIAGLFIYKASEEPRYPTGHLVNMGACVIAACISIILVLLYVSLNRKLVARGKSQPLWAL